jgi:flagellar biogenesis protein FliO
MVYQNPQALVFPFLYLAFTLGVTFFVLWMLWRLVRAFERLAQAAEIISRRPQDGAKG